MVSADYAGDGLAVAGGLDLAVARVAASHEVGYILGEHPCELSKSRNIHVCAHPDHPRAERLALAFLEMIGLLPTARITTGICQVCGHQKLVRRTDGRICKHQLDGVACPGGGRTPVREET